MVIDTLSLAQAIQAEFPNRKLDVKMEVTPEESALWLTMDNHHHVRLTAKDIGRIRNMRQSSLVTLICNDFRKLMARGTPCLLVDTVNPITREGGRCLWNSVRNGGNNDTTR